MGQLVIVMHGLLIGRHARQKKARIKSTWRAYRGNPARDIMHGRGIQQQCLAIQYFQKIQAAVIDTVTIGRKAADDIRLKQCQGRLADLMQAQQDACFFKGFSNRRHVISQAALFQTQGAAGFSLGAMHAILAVICGTVANIHRTTRKHPHTAGKGCVGIPLHHKNLQIRLVVNQNHRCCCA